MLSLELNMVLQKKSNVEVESAPACMKLPPVVRVFPSLVKYDFAVVQILCFFLEQWGKRLTEGLPLPSCQLLYFWLVLIPLTETLFSLFGNCHNLSDESMT